MHHTKYWHLCDQLQDSTFSCGMCDVQTFKWKCMYVFIYLLIYLFVLFFSLLQLGVTKVYYFSMSFPMQEFLCIMSAIFLEKKKKKSIQFEYMSHF